MTISDLSKLTKGTMNFEYVLPVSLEIAVELPQNDSHWCNAARSLSDYL